MPLNHLQSKRGYKYGRDRAFYCKNITGLTDYSPALCVCWHLNRAFTYDLIINFLPPEYHDNSLSLSLFTTLRWRCFFFFLLCYSSVCKYRIVWSPRTSLPEFLSDRNLQYLFRILWSCQSKSLCDTFCIRFHWYFPRVVHSQLPEVSSTAFSFLPHIIIISRIIIMRVHSYVPIR